MMWTQGHQLQSRPYQILRQLGHGGFGLTFLAQDLSLNRQVVIKAPNRALERDQEYDKFIRRFRQEGEALAKITHPHVVQVIELFQEEKIPCLVLAYIEGETLNECIRQRGAIAEAEAVAIFRKLAMALQTLHQAGLIHCDVHPGNIMLRQGDQEPILIDFGSAKLLQPNTYTVTTTVNEGYAPYEQRRKDAEPNAKWDVYGLTATLYFAVTGQKPQTSVDRKLYGDALIAPQKHRPDLSAWLNQAILQGMDLEPDNRPASMQIWLGALHPPEPRIVKPPEPVKPPPSSRNRIDPPEPRKKRSAPVLPLGDLTYLMLGYIPNGILLGLSAASYPALALALAWALAGALAFALAFALAGAGALDRVGAFAWAWALAGAGAFALAWALALDRVGAFAFALALAGVWALAGALAGALAKALALAWALAGALLIGTVVGLAIQTEIGIWAGLGFGLLAVVQFWTIFGSMAGSYDALSENYRRLTIFVIWGITSTIGLALGGGIGWLLKLAGVSLPS